MESSRTRPSYPPPPLTTRGQTPTTHPHHAHQQHAHHPQHPHQQHPHTPTAHPAPPPPPPPSFSQPPPPTAQSSHPAPPPPQTSHNHYTAGPGPHSAYGPALPPIQHQQQYPLSGSLPEQLPPFRAPHPPQQQPHDAREAHDYHQYNQHNRSGHATPAPVNRSYSHDSSHQQRTPTTPAQPQPYLPPAPDGVQHPTPHHMDHPGHHSYPPTNGVPHGLPAGPPPHQGPPSSHLEQPYGMQPVMETHQYGPPPPAPPMYPQHYPPPISNVGFPATAKRKQMRATQACENCRTRKQKCDEGNPCSFCKESSLNCLYRDTPPAKTDKNTERILALLEQHATGLQGLDEKFERFSERLERVEQAQFQPDAHVDNSQYQAQPRPKMEPVQYQPPVHIEQLPVKEMTTKPHPQLGDHRTAPHKLILLWPTVRPLLLEAGVDVNESYVMEAEDRGMLRLYGRGEGIDEQDGTQPGGPASPARSEESTSMDAPTPPEGTWGRGFTSTSSTYGDPSRSYPYTAGGLKPDGSLDLDHQTVDSLYESYMKHIHVMHPFLDKQRVRKMFETFTSRYSPNSHHRSVQHSFAVSNNNESDRPLKRQRSNGSTVNTGMTSDGRMRAPDTERSPSNAIIFLVMALGKICLHREPLPGVGAQGKLVVNQLLHHTVSGSGFGDSSPISANIKPSPMSPKSTPGAHRTPPSIMEGGIRIESRSRRSSLDGSSSTVGLKNMDKIPGMAYYAKAAEILGDQGDGNDLVHAQMFLLAGLYKGQLARVKESMSWFTMAGRACRFLLDRYNLVVRPGDDITAKTGKGRFESLRDLVKDRRHHLIVLASWTVTQLESDILAELKVPSSGMQDLENQIPLPTSVTEEETYDSFEPLDLSDPGSINNIMKYYTAQMFLRRALNTVHKEMYGNVASDTPGSLEQVQNMLRQHDLDLTGWRNMLPDDLKWNDNDMPANDILAARLRAKYWGARYVINRPFLDYALHIMTHVKEGRSVRSIALDAYNKPRGKDDVVLFEAIEGMGEGAVWDAAKRCIEAALQSTVALDGVPGRLIVTNIHGTAHAQFGNMLVLSAVYNNKWMRPIVPRDRFEKLLTRTIAFLRKLAPISPTCSIDCGILERIQTRLFGPPADSKATYYNEGVVMPTSASNSFSM